MCREPLRSRVEISRCGDESSARCFPCDVVIGRVVERLDILSASFDRRHFDVRRCIRMIRLHQSNVLEEKLIAAGRAELATLEQNSYFGSGAVLVVGEDLDDDGHFAWAIALENDVLEW